MKAADSGLVASIRARLQNLARDSRQNLEELIYRYAIERFLYRLSQSRYQNFFVLKGGQVFAAWGISLGRPTRDIDLYGTTTNTVENLVQMVKEICDHEFEPDGMVFDSGSVIGQAIIENTDNPGVRLNFWSRLGSARVRMQMDIGFSDVITPKAVSTIIPTLLDMPAPRMLLYPPESVIAEKLQAMVYLGEINNRMKDFYDIWLLSRRFDFDGAILQKAIVATFQNRKTPISIDMPFALTDQFAAQKQIQWGSGFLGKFLTDPGELIDFHKVINDLQNFLNPPLIAAASGEIFDQVWKAGAGWYAKT